MKIDKEIYKGWGLIIRTFYLLPIKALHYLNQCVFGFKFVDTVLA